MRDGLNDCLRHPVRCLAWAASYPRPPRRYDYGIAWLFILTLVSAIVIFTLILAS